MDWAAAVALAKAIRPEAPRVAGKVSPPQVREPVEVEVKTPEAEHTTVPATWVESVTLVQVSPAQESAPEKTPVAALMPPVMSPEGPTPKATIPAEEREIPVSNTAVVTMADADHPKTVAASVMIPASPVPPKYLEILKKLAGLAPAPTRPCKAHPSFWEAVPVQEEPTN